MNRLAGNPHQNPAFLHRRIMGVSGNSHTLATKSDGTLWAWGSDAFGQLGDASSATSLTPVQVGTSTAWVAVPLLSASSHSLAITADGTLWGFGLAASGQIGFAWRSPLAPDVVLPAPSPAQGITFTLPPNISTGSTVTLSAVTGSGLPAIYIVAGPATLAGDQLTITGPAPVLVSAFQPGDNYWQASDVALRAVNAPSPAITGVSVTSLTATTATLNATINPNGSVTNARDRKSTRLNSSHRH